jgi:lipopolysaccharide transport system ATP-binding protein
VSAFEPLVELAGVTKRFPRVARPRDRMRALGRLLLGREPLDPIPVLENIALRVERGQSLGIIGENGAGKSTLLKVLTGVLAPSAGVVRVNGSHAALLELGAGFHPEYTGRANVEMAGALMGFSTRELRAKLDEILDFADIGRYIDEPVKHYSSGMVVRLGFALVAARRPDLLITDEVLAVGDEAFQRKCVAWIESYLGGGGTLLLVSHSMYHVQKLCKQALWLHRGRVEAYGEVHDVTQRYLAYEETRIAEGGASHAQSSASLEFAVTALELNGGSGEGECAVEAGADLLVRAQLRSRSGRAPHLALGVVRADGTPVYGTGSEFDRAAPERMDDNAYAYTVRFPRLALLPGSYLVRAHALDPEGMRLFDCLERVLVVRGTSREFGLVRLEHEWLDPARPAETPRAARTG